MRERNYFENTTVIAHLREANLKLMSRRFFNDGNHQTKSDLTNMN